MDILHEVDNLKACFQYTVLKIDNISGKVMKKLRR
jgi:hypothetical protein